MRPKEFISRSLDLVDYAALKWPVPDSFNSAALGLSLMAPNGHVIEVNGYRVTLTAQNCLGHIVMLSEVHCSEMIAETVLLPSPSQFMVGASICFTFQELDFRGEQAETEHIYESWRLPENHDETIDRIMEVLTFFTLKTNHRIHHKVSPL